MLAKVTSPEESVEMAAICLRLESALGLRTGMLQVELMIETPQSIFNVRGELNLLPLVAAAQGRCVGAHFGTYDYTAGRGITAAHQHMMHFACDFAKEAMQVAYAGTGIWLSDGARNILPAPVHPGGVNASSLMSGQSEDTLREAHTGRKLHFEHVRHSL